MEYEDKYDELMNEHGKIFDALVQWFRGTSFKILHFWDADDIFYIVTQHENGRNKVITMIRVFWLGSYKLSVDNSIFM